MIRALLLLGVLIAWANAVHAEQNWTGSWDTRWRGGGARLQLEQHGDEVTGRYPLYDGQVAATIKDGRLEGRWTEPDDSGGFVFVLGSDGNSFAGRYDTGEWWTGKRVTSPPIAPPFDLSSPREALRSFTIASNLARGGLPDARGVAAATIDFGPNAAAISRSDRLDRTAALFDLIDLTTFRIWSLPENPSGDSVTVQLEQSDTGVKLPLTFVRGKTGKWRIRMPTDEEMAAARRTLLAQTGGQPRPVDAYLQLQNPRDTMRAFLEGMAKWDKGGKAQALSTMDLSAMPEVLRTGDGTLAAQYLRRVLDQIGLVGMQAIPNSGITRDAYVHFVHPAGRIVIAPIGTGADTRWKFTTETVADIDRIFVAIENLPAPDAVAPGLIPPSEFFVWRAFVQSHAPALLHNLGPLEYWQLLGLVVLISSVFSIGFFIGPIVLRAVGRLISADTKSEPKFVGWSLGFVMAVMIGSRFAPSLGMPEEVRQYTYPGFGMLLTVSAGYLAWHLIGMAAGVLDRRAERTSTATDDILITLILAAARLGIVIMGSLSIAYFLSLPTSGVLAGVGIGGLAFAFASKETLSNVFGAGILVSDRPFRHGDWISAGEVEGSIEHVGIRSTRVRTAQDSLMVVPNGKLADSIINNLGTRRHRLIRAKILVTAASGSPDRLDAFATSVRERIIDDPAFVAARTDVGISSIGDGGIELEITSYLNASTTTAERAARHALMLDVLRLAGRAGLTLGAGMAPLTEPIPAD